MHHGSPASLDQGAASARICILLNPGSGKKRGADAEAEIREVAKALSLDVTLRLLDRDRSIGAQTRAAVKDGFGMIVAAGGDGTICGVAAALAGTDQLMGVLPLGTFNYFARSMNIPQDIEGALKVIAEGHECTRSAGRVNDHVFLNNASLGAYPAILKKREQIYDRWGRSRVAAYWSVLVALLDSSHMMSVRITVDGEERRMRTPLIFMMHNAYQLEQLGLEGEEHIRDGKFAVFIARDEGRLGMIRHAIGLARGRLEKSKDFELLSGCDIRIDTGLPRNRVARDGEREMMPGPFHFEVIPDALRIVIPREVA